MRSRYRCSMCPAIHINSRSWLRSSSTHEPSDPPPRVLITIFATSMGRPQRIHARHCEKKQPTRGPSLEPRRAQERTSLWYVTADRVCHEGDVDLIRSPATSPNVGNPQRSRLSPQETGRRRGAGKPTRRVETYGSFITFGNDPSAGSPTETLLRLLLPLDDQVRSSSRHTGTAVTRHARTNPRISLNHPIGSSDGRCVQRAGT